MADQEQTQAQDSQNVLRPQYHRVDSLNFYDLIILVNSLANIQKSSTRTYGWEIKAKPENYEKYLKNKIKPMTVLGVIGQGNRGKSFILSKISNIAIPSGFSVTTEGLSVKFPDPEGNTSKQFIVLDSAGSEPPVKETENFKLNSNCDSQTAQKEIALISRDKKMTETFLQNFIIHNANVVILVIGQLTSSEQKMYNKLKKIPKKQLLVVHNLYNFITKDQVTDYIDNTLLETMMIKLERQNFVGFDKDDGNQYPYYFVERVGKENPKIITHVIIAKELETSEAGKYFNPPAFEYLRKLVTAEVTQKKFDIVEKLKNFLVSASLEMIEPKIEYEDIIEEVVGEKRMIYIKDDITLENGQKKIHELKKILINELGISSYYSPNFVPNYSCVFNTKTNEVILEIELPGERPNVSLRAKLNDDIYVFTCKGEKILKDVEKDEKKFLFSTLKKGNFEFNFKVSISKGLLSSTNKKFSPEYMKDEKGNYKGIVQFKIPLEVVVNEEAETFEL